jgi:predicted TIM-barrel fold metal-dependent hydrolase
MMRAAVIGVVALLGVSVSAQVARPTSVPAPAVDHHQHLVSPELVALVAATPPGQLPAISAADLIGHLDAAGIRRAVVHSTAYINTQPTRKVDNAYERVRADNDWTSRQVAQYRERLVGFCAVNPLADWAADEIRRCARDPYLRRGVHRGDSEEGSADDEPRLRCYRDGYRGRFARREGVAGHADSPAWNRACPVWVGRAGASESSGQPLADVPPASAD